MEVALFGYKRLALDARGTDFLLGCLGEGLTLARELAKSNRVPAGRGHACVPLEVTEAQAYRFDEGFALKPRSASLWDIASDLLYKGLFASPARVIIGEDLLMRPGDPIAARCPVEMFVSDDRYYAVLGSDTWSPDTQRQMLSWVGFAHQAFFVVDTEGYPEKLAGVVPGSALSGLVPRIRQVLVQAYDDEGYVTWMP